MFRTSLFCLLMLGMISQAAAQVVDWTPTPEDFTAVYDSFPDPEAVVQYEFGKIVAEMDEIRLTYYVRIHILKESGREYADVEARYLKKDGFMRVKEARAYNLSESGEIVVTELDRGDILKEAIDDDVMELKFSIPDTRVGSIITYEYERKIPSIYTYTWRFQSPIPCVVSKFSFSNDSRLNYSNVFLGVMSEKLISAGNEHVMTYLPGTVNEPYVPNERSYQPRMRFQLASYFSEARQTNVPLLTNWPTFGKAFMELDYISSPGKKKGKLRIEAEQLTFGYETPEEKARVIYQYILDNFTWDEEYRLIPEQAPMDLMESKTGSSADINTLLYHMLRFAGLEPQYAAVGTREYGAMIPQFPIMGQFNALLVYLELGDRTYALDATDPTRPFELPPREALNRIFLVIGEENTRWQEIPVNQVTKSSANGLLKITEEGTLTGKLSVTHTGYQAVQAKKLLADGDLESYLEWTWENELMENDIESFSIRGVGGADSTLKVTMNLAKEDFAMAAGDFIYLQPIFLDNITENPFKDSVRVYPVDFSYPTSSEFRLTYILPPGYTIDDFPENSRVVLPGNEMSFTYLAENQVISCSVVNKLEFNETFYDPRDNGKLRMLFDEIIDRHGQQLVLKRATE